MGLNASRRKPPRPQDVYDTYITRWDFYPKHIAFFQGPAGSVVTAMRFHPKVHYTCKDTKETKFMEDMVYVMGTKHRGLIPVIYLQLYNPIGRPMGMLGDVLRQYEFKRELIESKWYIPFLSFPKISIYFAENVIEAGSWIICNPQETLPTNDRWPDFWLAIKTFDGPPSRMVEVFEEGMRFNRKLAERVSLEPRKSKFMMDLEAKGDEILAEADEYDMRHVWQRLAMFEDENKGLVLEMMEMYLKDVEKSKRRTKRTSDAPPRVSKKAKGGKGSKNTEEKALAFGEIVKMANRGRTKLVNPGKDVKARSPSRETGGTDHTHTNTDKSESIKDKAETAHQMQSEFFVENTVNSIDTSHPPAMPADDKKSVKGSKKSAKESKKSVKASPKVKKKPKKGSKESHDKPISEGSKKKSGKVGRQKTTELTMTSDVVPKPEDNGRNNINSEMKEPRKVLADMFPGILDPPPALLYLRIRRTITGRFYLFHQHLESFPTIYHLLEAYMGVTLPLDTSYPVVLGEPVRYHAQPQLGIKPLEMPIPAPPRPRLRCIGLARTLSPLWTEKKNKFEKNGPIDVVPYKTCPAAYSFAYVEEELQKLAPTSPVGPGSFGNVSVRKKKFKSVIKYMKDQYINHEQFLKDVMRIFSDTRVRQEFLVKEPHCYDPTGVDYLAKLNGFNIVSARKWIGFAHVGMYSLPEMMKLWTDEKKMLVWRGKLEIIYQISTAMRHLEQNGLCHRALKASNVIVKEAGDFNWRVLVTDYMLPYGFLVNKSSKSMDYTRFHWRWMAPESLTKAKFDITSDIWSFGCTMFEVFTWGREPWGYDKDVRKPSDVMDKVEKHKKMSFGSENEHKIPDYLKKLVEICITKNEKNRPTFLKLQSFLGGLLYDSTRPVERVIYDTVDRYIKMSQNNKNLKTSEVETG